MNFFNLDTTDVADFIKQIWYVKSTGSYTSLNHTHGLGKKSVHKSGCAQHLSSQAKVTFVKWVYVNFLLWNKSS